MKKIVVYLTSEKIGRTISEKTLTRKILKKNF